MKRLKAIPRWFHDHPGWKVGNPMGVPLYVRPSAIAMLVWLGPWLSIADPLVAVVFVLSHAPTVLLHEYGHVWMMKHLGYTPDKVEYQAGGGLASYTGGALPPPEHDLKIALAGPAVSLMIVGIAFFVSLSPNDLVVRAALMVLVLNSAAAFVNLLPFLPLDGGNFWRAWLRKYKGLSYVEATKRVNLFDRSALETAQKVQRFDKDFRAVVESFTPDDPRRHIAECHQKMMVFASGDKIDALWETFRLALETASPPPEKSTLSKPSYADWYEAHKHEWSTP